MPKIKGQKHHYIPVFYLKNWVGADRKLCELSRPAGPAARVKALRKHPGGTGYARGLYSIPFLPSDTGDVLETRFLKRVDDIAARATAVLLSGSNSGDFDIDTRSGWSRFLNSLILRNPEYVAFTRKKMEEIFAGDTVRMEKFFEAHRNPDDPLTLTEFFARERINPVGVETANQLQSLIDNRRIGEHVNRMIWTVVRLRDPKFELLTSDRPIVMSNGIAFPDSYIVVPLAPRAIFIATNNQNTANILSKDAEQGRLVRGINDRMATQAYKYVFATDDSQLKFVEKRLGARMPSTPLDVD